jgi:hypothetical protein
MDCQQATRSSNQPTGSYFYCRHENEVINFTKMTQATTNSASFSLTCRVCHQKQPASYFHQPYRPQLDTSYSRKIENTYPFWTQAVSSQFQPNPPSKTPKCDNSACQINISNLKRNRHMSKTVQKPREPEPVRAETKTQTVITKTLLPPKLVVQQKPQPKVKVIPRLPPKVKVVSKVKYLGVVNADPDEYVKKYGSTLMPLEEISNYVTDLKLSPSFFKTDTYPHVQTTYDDELRRYLEATLSQQKSFTRNSTAIDGTSPSAAIRDLFDFIDVPNRGVIKLGEACGFLPGFDPGKYDLRAVRILLGINDDHNYIDLQTFQKLYKIFTNN